MDGFDLASLRSGPLVPTVVVTATALTLVLQFFLRTRRPRPGRDPASEHWRWHVAAGVLMLTSALATDAWIDGDTWSLLGWGQAMRALPWAALAAVVMGVGSALASRKPDFRDHYPEAPVSRWTATTWRANVATWAIYLLGYELLLRGLCVGVLVNAWGTTAGVAVTTAIYAVAHLPKNMSEAMGSFPMGVVLAALTLSSGSIWPAWALHVVMAVTADTMALWSPATS